MGPTEARTSHRQRRRLRRGLLTVALALGAGSQLGFSCEATCSAPYRPVGGDDVEIGRPPSGDWPVPATAVARPGVTGPLDTDGDGAADTLDRDGENRTLVIHRSSGDLILTVAAPALFFTDSLELLQAGDVDGDGRDDLTVVVAARLPENATDQPPTTTYLVGGAAADGTYAVADAGAVLLPPGDLRTVDPVGDVDGDGLGDLAAVTIPTETQAEDTWIWPGDELTTAPGAPVGDPSLHPPAGAFLGAVPLDGRSAVVMATHRADGAEPYHEFQLWVPEGGLTFTTAGAGPVATVQPIGMGTAPGQFRVLDDGGDRWLTATLQNRGQTQRWAWDLDDLCANTPVTS
jgi:hypothetical protein